MIGIIRITFMISKDHFLEERISTKIIIKHSAIKVYLA